MECNETNDVAEMPTEGFIEAVDGSQISPAWGRRKASANRAARPHQRSNNPDMTFANMAQVRRTECAQRHCPTAWWSRIGSSREHQWHKWEARSAHRTVSPW